MGLELLFSFEHHVGVRHSESPVISWGQALGDTWSPVLFFFFFWRFFNFKIAPHFTAGKSFSSHQHFENTKLENFFLEHKLSAEVALHLTWKEKLAFTKLQQFLAYSCSKADIWDASLILVATKVLFSSLMFWGNTWLFSLFLATKTYRCNLCLSRKKMEIKSVHQIWYDENYCHTIKII